MKLRAANRLRSHFGPLICAAALGLWLLSLGGAFIASDSDQSPRRAVDVEFRVPAAAPANLARGSQTGVPLIGMTLNVYHTQDFDVYLHATDRIAELGFNTLQVVTPAFQRDGAAGGVDLQIGPGRGPSPKQLIALLRRAKKNQLQTVLMPQVNFTHPRGNEWRGKIQPPRWQPWWDRYRRVIDRFLTIAVEADVDVFTVGCELVTTEKAEHLDAWRQIIAHCRRKFSGPLTYSTVWNHYQAPQFWQLLDYVGVSGYWDLTRDAADPKAPTDVELAKRWRQIQQELFAYAQTQGRPVLVTEVGYPSLPWALKDPWNYVNNDDAIPDAAAQARAYGAFVAAWRDWVDPADERLAGVLFYKWDVFARKPSRDTGYSIVGKPAFEVVAEWLRSRERSDKTGADRAERIEETERTERTERTEGTRRINE